MATNPKSATPGSKSSQPQAVQSTGHQYIQVESYHLMMRSPTQYILHLQDNNGVGYDLNFSAPGLFHWMRDSLKQFDPSPEQQTANHLRDILAELKKTSV